MADKITYYAIADERHTAENPAGLARRIEHEGGGVSEDALRRDMDWHPTGLLAEWRRAESAEDMVEVSGTEAERIMAELRERWSKLP